MERDANLDFTRSLSLLLIIIYHVSAFVPFNVGSDHWLTRISDIGIYGVPLFFILSGWLIGLLYWKELQRFGSVHIRLFLARRWLRTLPAYYLMLMVAWSGAYFTRGQPFDPAYSYFLQNYDSVFPFYSVSWTLCIEEHFYLFLPFVLALLVRLRLPIIPILFLIAMSSIAFRYHAIPPHDFYHLGAITTATHINLTSLAIGVLFAYIKVNHAHTWQKIQRVARWFWPATPLILISSMYWPLSFIYADGYLIVQLAWAIFLAALAGKPAIIFAKPKITHYLALWSYSIYLTHTSILQMCSRVTIFLHGSINPITWLSWIIAVILSGAALYYAFEVPMLRLRSYLAPPRNATGEIYVGRTKRSVPAEHAS